ncbi:MAG: YcaO-like family protein [Solimonas sp.]
MAQVETAFALIAAKLEEGGAAALDEVDRRHLKRGEVDVATCTLLHPDGAARRWPARAEQAASLEELVGRLDRQGFGVWLVDLTRPDYGIATVRALAPHLQPFPSIHRTKRLLSTVEICGGGDQYGAGFEIM